MINTNNLIRDVSLAASSSLFRSHHSSHRLGVGPSFDSIQLREDRLNGWERRGRYVMASR